MRMTRLGKRKRIPILTVLRARKKFRPEDVRNEDRMTAVAPTPPLTLDEQYDDELARVRVVLARLGFEEVDDDTWGFRAPDLAGAPGELPDATAVAEQ
jgi:hypothetical protein